MIEIRESGSIFDCGADAVVIPVNSMGVAGKGLALEAKKRWPEWFSSYKMVCKLGGLKPGGTCDWSMFGGAPGYPKFVISAATKGHWQSQSHMLDIMRCIDRLSTWALKAQPDVMAIPAIGCGLGGLRWKDVKEYAEERLAPLGSTRTTVLLFSPQ